MEDRWRNYRYQIQDEVMDELTMSEQRALYEMLRAYAEEGDFHDEMDMLRLEYLGAVTYLYKAGRIKEAQKWDLWGLTDYINEQKLEEEQHHE